MESQDSSTGAVNCSGSLSLDLPPGVGSRGGPADADRRRGLYGAAGRRRQRQCRCLCATPTRSSRRLRPWRASTSRQPRCQPSAGERHRDGESAKRRRSTSPADAGRRVGQQPQRGRASTPAGARPSFDCAKARTKGEIAVCSDAGLAALDRNMAAQYRRAIAEASPEEQARCCGGPATASSPIATAARAARASATPMSAECARSATSWKGAGAPARIGAIVLFRLACLCAHAAQHSRSRTARSGSGGSVDRQGKTWNRRSISSTGASRNSPSFSCGKSPPRALRLRAAAHSQR